MPGPWEQYQSAPAAEGPWSQYSAPQERALGPPARAFKIGAEGLPEQVAEVARYTHPAGQLLGGIGGAISDLTTRIGQASAFANRGGVDTPAPQLTPQQKIDLQANRALYKESPMANLGNIATNIGLTWPAAGPLYQGAKSAISAGLPSFAQFLAPTTGAAATGGAMALTQPTLPGESIGDQAKGGALGGAIADAALRGVGRIIQPITQSEPVKKLLEHDIVPSIGQALGGMGARLEEKASSLPFIGDVIRNARGRANSELQLAQLQKVDPSIKVAGREGLQKADDAVDTAYRDALAGIPQVTMTQKFEDTVRQGVVNDPSRMLGTDQRNTIEKFLDSSIFSNFKNNNGVITGEQAKVLDSKIGEAVRNSGDNSVRNAMRDIQSEFRQLLKDGATTPEAAKALSAADKMYKDYLISVKAMAKPGAEGGNFSPNQLASAVREMDRSKDKRMYAKGEAYGQDLSDAAKSVLSDKVPNSGTTDRALAALLLGGAGAAASHQEVPGFNMFGPAYWLGLGASPLLYSRAGSRYMMGDLSPAQPALAGALRQGAPYAAQAGALYR